MKTIVISDVHGRDTWKKIIEVESEKQQPNVIFLGDYVDSFDKSFVEQLDNLKEILLFKQLNNDTVTLLIGNHDYHYMNNGTQDRYSGFQKNAYVVFNNLYEENKKCFQVAYSQDNILFTHAGVSVYWLPSSWSFYSQPLEQLVIKINDLFHYKPSTFGFNSEDFSGYGEHRKQGPLWIRPQSLYRSVFEIKGKPFYQVVGHTQVKKIVHPVGNHCLYFTDCQDNLEPDYLVIEDGIISIKTLKAG